MKTTVQISISRNSDDMVSLRIVDSTSRVEFVDARITLKNYAQIITGLSSVEVDAELRGMDKVGKTKIFEKRKIVCPLNTYDKRELRAWLIAECQEVGWELDAYLGSQSSVSRSDEGVVLNYGVVKYQ